MYETEKEHAVTMFGAEDGVKRTEEYLDKKELDEEANLNLQSKSRS